MIKFAHAVGLVMSLACYGILEDLLMKARVGSGSQRVTLRYPALRSPFPSVAGSKMGDSVASRSAYSLPSITETESSNFLANENVLQQPCSSRQADVCLVLG